MLVARGTSARYASTGHLIYAAGNNALHAVPFDLNRRMITGDAVPDSGGRRDEAERRVGLRCRGRTARCSISPGRAAARLTSTSFCGSTNAGASRSCRWRRAPTPRSACLKQPTMRGVPAEAQKEYRVSITSEPSGATVYLGPKDDGDELGETPFTGALPPVRRGAANRLLREQRRGLSVLRRGAQRQGVRLRRALGPA